MPLFEKILLKAKTIVVVGLSTNPLKDSHIVAKYLQEHGYRVVPVHPSAEKILGERVFHSLLEIDFPVDIVDVFRPSEECAEIAEQAVKLNPKLLWLQLGIENLGAKKIAQKNGIEFVQNKCIKIEHSGLV